MAATAIPQIYSQQLVLRGGLTGGKRMAIALQFIIHNQFLSLSAIRNNRNILKRIFERHSEAGGE